MAKIHPVTRPALNPYNTQVNTGATSSGQKVGYLVPSGGIGPHTGVPAGGYKHFSPEDTEILKMHKAHQAAHGRAATGVMLKRKK